MKLLVFGKTGQVAVELQKQYNCVALGRDQADLNNPDACAQIIYDQKPDVVINAAAFTAVDHAEANEGEASVVNGEAPAAMAKTAAALKIPLLHISTDYVFDGTGDHSRKPDEMPDPVSAYGRSKLLGETGVQAADGIYAILRTSWVFSATGNNFVKTMLRLGRERDSLSIVDDQIGGPTPASGIASASLTMAKAFHSGSGKSGIYHYSGAPSASWKDFAEEIFRQSGISVEVLGITSEQYPTPAVRPLNSSLDCKTLEQVFGVTQPDWRLDLRQILTQLKEIR